MAKVFVDGMEIEIPDDLAMDMVRPYIEMRACELTTGDPVVARVKPWRSGHGYREQEKEYGPMFILGRVAVEDRKTALYVPQHVNPTLAEIKSVHAVPGVANAYKALCANLELFRHPEWDPK